MPGSDALTPHSGARSSLIATMMAAAVWRNYISVKLKEFLPPDAHYDVARVERTPYIAFYIRALRHVGNCAHIACLSEGIEIFSEEDTVGRSVDRLNEIVFDISRPVSSPAGFPRTVSASCA